MPRPGHGPGRSVSFPPPIIVYATEGAAMREVPWFGMTIDMFVGASSLAGGDQGMYRKSLRSKIIWFSERDHMKSADWTTARQVPAHVLRASPSASNMVMDARPKGQPGKAPHFISGTLASIDNGHSQMTLSTSGGEKNFTLKPESRMFRDIAVGAHVTIEVNDTGEVIDLHKDIQ